MPPYDPLSEKAAAVLGRFPGPVTLHPSRLKWVVVLILGALSLGNLVRILWPHLPHLSGEAFLILGMIVAVPVLLFSFLATITLGRDIPRMTLDADRFEVRSLWGIHRMCWSDVTQFRLFLLLALHDDAKPPRGLWDRLNRPRIWNDTFGLGAKNFARLMTAWRERALASRT